MNLLDDDFFNIFEHRLLILLFYAMNILDGKDSV